MARISKNKNKLCRRERYDLFPRLGSQSQVNKRLLKRTAPGEHPMFPRQSLYANQRRETQKVKRMYGLLERQFRRFYRLAEKSKETTGTALLQLLELRLDNVLFRAGVAKTRDQARQLVAHGHVKVNGKRLGIPSYIVEMNDVISLDDKILKLNWYEEIVKINETYQAPSWINKESQNKLMVVSKPSRDDIDLGINEQLIVEFYSK